MSDLIDILYTFYLDNTNTYYQCERGGACIRKDYSNIYIPYKLFNKIGSTYGWFRFSRLLGQKGDNLYFIYRETCSYCCSNPSNACQMNVDTYNYRVLVLNTKEYTYDAYLVPDRLLNLAKCYNQSSDQFCASTGYNFVSDFFGSNYQLANGYTMHVGTSYLDDFMYSTKSTDIFIMGLYFFIPLLLFILAIKVLRKGLFK